MEDPNPLLELINNKTAREFLAIAFLAPLVAGLVAFIGERLGVSGQIKRLEALEKRLALANDLLKTTDLPDETRANLTAQLDEIATALVTEFGPADQDAIDGTTRGGAPQAWEKLPLLRRVVLLPAPRTPLGWTVIILFYYMLFSVVVVSIALITGDISVDGMRFGLFAYVAILFGLQRAVRTQYRKYVHTSAQRGRNLRQPPDQQT